MSLLLAVGVFGAGLLTYRVLAAGQVDEKKQEGQKPAGNAKLATQVTEQLNRMKLELAQKELVQVQSDIRKENVELAHLRGREKSIDSVPVPESTIEELINRDPIIDQRLQREVELRQSIAEIENVSAEGGRAPGVRDLQTKLAATEKILATRRAKLRTQIIEQLRLKARDEFKAKVAQHEDTISFLTELEQALKTDIQRLSAGS
jgi:hypothetical protein